MGIFSWLLGDNSQPQPAVAMTQMAMPPATAAAPVDPAAVANDNQLAEVPFDLVGRANLNLAQALALQPVKKRMVNPTTGNERWMELNMPVSFMQITGPKIENAGLISVRGRVDEQVVLNLGLQDAVGNYDLDSINRAIHNVLSRVSVLTGKLETLKPLKIEKMDHADVWKELLPILVASGKFNESEIGLINQYFDTHKRLSAEQADWSHLRLEHAGGKIQIQIRPAEVKGDDKEVMSGEVRVVKYFEEHKDKILTKIREKLASVISAEELAHLDFTVAIKKAEWGDMPTIEFGAKPVPPSTELGKTAMADIDLDKVSALFKQTILEADKEIPFIFGRIADGDMVRHIVRQRLGDTPAVNKALSHPMFNSQEEQKTHDKAVEAKGLITIPSAAETEKPHTLTIAFNLPHGVNLATFREAIARDPQIFQQPALGITA